ncbi:Holliday junction branch migration protein RuvA [Terriglobus aquaticus]|uniref:Holliday junction branch migration complex subunit RuvA n=1 Tax=Terriglobus aquaticus TaxID=940139 RepID=A0ABW9KJ46_9BACT|nr:Holliday junction branch migration protein RuvA [Terriglobus aquaticus]
MIAHLRGTLLSKTPNRSVVECGGVGYAVTTSVQCYTALPEQGSPVALHIHTEVREDSIALFGFLDPSEQLLFEKLITISGVGPKLAITLLSGIRADALAAAIRSSSHAELVRIPGIGKKTAERIVLELKDKLDGFATPAPTQAAAPALTPAADDVLSALVNLGYSRPAAQKAVESALNSPEATSLTLHNDFEQLFRLSMRLLR